MNQPWIDRKIFDFTARELVHRAEQAFEDAALVFGHGTDNARDEAVFLVFHALDLPFDCEEHQLDASLTAAEIDEVVTVVQKRLDTRKPAAYLTNKMWFAGHEFYVDENVLVPRSPLAEVITNGLMPWLNGEHVARALEIGTGSGCIALSLGLAFPKLRIDATDISADALAVAAINQAKYREAGQRVKFINADLFPADNPPEGYDLIVTNPPYVPEAVVDGLPEEYQHEPRLGLSAGEDGLDVLRRIISRAPGYLQDGGALLVDVGEMANIVDRTFADVNFTWVDLEYGGEGIGIAFKSDFLTS